MKRIVREGQLYRDLARDMIDRDRRLRVLSIGDDGRAECRVEHDLDGTTGRRPFIQAKALAVPSRYELVEDAAGPGNDPRYLLLLAAVAAVHGPAATPADYARAAWDILGPKPAEAGTQRATDSVSHG
ncbi:hypothetical protein GCM10010371_63580 [Streptomyces subrutilus]|uniref:Uncharacterized protein n=1 Tax=Streptomyces subrutilus TaxID=36818 RepID=A0A918RH87_9ACTN|nr:DUF6354 family protein [Streptomyces subrutilus]GGZ94986.1 hypothetical protein GCM10010371_63580 [Streptomyces subrutilus]